MLLYVVVIESIKFSLSLYISIYHIYVYIYRTTNLTHVNVLCPKWQVFIRFQIIRYSTNKSITVMYQSEKSNDWIVQNWNMLLAPTPDSGFEALVHAVDLDPMVLDAASSVGAMPPAMQGLQASLGWKTSPDIPCEAIVKWLLLISFRISREGGSLVWFFSYIWIHLILLWLKLECRLTLPR